METYETYMTDDGEGAALTRAELAMIRAIEAFGRWCFFLNKTVCGSHLSASDVWLLHSIRMRGGAQNLSELLLFLNRNDVSALQYSLRKIEQDGLIKRIAGRSKREAGYELTEAGLTATNAYAAVRKDILLSLICNVNGLVPALAEAASALERLTGLYDQSTQTVLNRHILGGRPSS